MGWLSMLSVGLPEDSLAIFLESTMLSVTVLGQSRPASGACNAKLAHPRSAELRQAQQGTAVIGGEPRHKRVKD